MKNILIVDDHPAIRMAVKILLESAGYEDIREATNGVDAVKMTHTERFDLVILDIGIPQLDGMEVMNRLRKLQPIPKILVLTTQPSEHFATRCLHMGASGFVSKSEDITNIIDASRAILSGHSYFPVASFHHQNAALSGQESEMLKLLSDREMMVLQQLSQGLTNKEIADKMILSNKTISTYKTRLMEKLGSSSLLELIEFAKRNGVV